VIFRHFVTLCLLTPWNSVFEKLKVPSADKWIPLSFVIPVHSLRFHLYRSAQALSEARIQSTSYQTLFLRTIRLLTSRLRLGLPSYLFPSSRFSTKISYTFLMSTMKCAYHCLTIAGNVYETQCHSIAWHHKGIGPVKTGARYVEPNRIFGWLLPSTRICCKWYDLVKWTLVTWVFQDPVHLELTCPHNIVGEKDPRPIVWQMSGCL
jgi:hypothetical protein